MKEKIYYIKGGFWGMVYDESLLYDAWLNLNDVIKATVSLTFNGPLVIGDAQNPQYTLVLEDNLIKKIPYVVEVITLQKAYDSLPTVSGGGATIDTGMNVFTLATTELAFLASTGMLLRTAGILELDAASIVLTTVPDVADPFLNYSLVLENGQVKKTPALNPLTHSWGLTGNPGTDPAVNFIGTRDNQPLRIGVNNKHVAQFDSGGRLTYGDLSGAVGTDWGELTTRGLSFINNGNWNRQIKVELGGFTFFNANNPALLAIYAGVLGVTRVSNYDPNDQFVPLIISGNHYSTSKGAIEFHNGYSVDQRRIIIYAEPNGLITPVSIIPGNDGTLIVGGDKTKLDVTAIMSIESTTRGFLLPRMTTAQKLKMVGGIVSISIYNYGSGYTNGTYNNVPLVGGTGSGAMFTTMVFSGGSYSYGGLSRPNYAPGAGTNYTVGDLLTVPSLPGGTGLTFRVEEINAIADGLQVYDTTLHKPYYWNSAAWTPVGAGWELSGNAGTDQVVNFIGTTDAQDLSFKRNNKLAITIGEWNIVVGVGYNFVIPINQQLRLGGGSGIYTKHFGTDSLDVLAFANYVGMYVFCSEDSLVNYFYIDGRLSESYLNLSSFVVGSTVKDSSAVLKIDSTTKGALLPRVTTAQKLAILAPTEGLEVFDLNFHQKSYYDGSQWMFLAGSGSGGSSPWIVSGNDIYSNNSGNVGIGTTTPATKLDVSGLVKFSNTVTDVAPNDATLLVTPTWNTNDANGFPAAIRVNVTNTLSRGGARLMDLQVGGISLFTVHKTGATTVSSGTGSVAINDPALGNPLIRITTGAGQSIPQIILNDAGNTAAIYSIEVGRGTLSNLAFRNNATEMARFSSSGNFGVGSSNPIATIEALKDNNGALATIAANNPNVGTAAQARVSLFNNTGTGANRGATVFLMSSNFTPTASYANAFGFWNYETGPMLFATSNAERLRIDELGKVTVNGSPQIIDYTFSVKSLAGKHNAAFQDQNSNNLMLMGGLSGTTGFMGVVATLIVGHYTILETSALMDVRSTTKGVLMPRMTTAQKLAILTPANGLMVYDTTLNKLSIYESTAWAAYNSGWSLAGNAGINPATQFIGTTDAQTVNIRTNNLDRLSIEPTGRVTVNAAALADTTFSVKALAGWQSFGALDQNGNYLIRAYGVGASGYVTFGSGGGVLIGANTGSEVTAILEVRSTTKGVLLPRMTTAQKLAILTPANGLIVYDTDLNKLSAYESSVWNVVGNGGTGSWTVAAGKTPAINNSITFNGADGTTMTFPTSSATLARVDNSNTFNNVQNFLGNVAIGPSSLIVAQTATQLSLYHRQDIAGGIGLVPNGATTMTSGSRNAVIINDIFSPTSGTAALAALYVTATINQTGGANGQTFGIRINPIITAAADWRSLQIDNNSGYAIHQSGAAAQNYFAGNVGLGTASPLSRLHVNGAIRLTGSGVFAAGVAQMYMEPTAGLIITVGTGSTSDFTLASSGGQSIMQNPTGTNNLTITPYTGGLLGIGTAPVLGQKVSIGDVTLAGSGALAGGLLNMFQTWNTTASPTAIKLNITNTASGTTANMLDLQLDTVSVFKVNRFGMLNINNSNQTNYTLAVKAVTGTGAMVIQDQNLNSLFLAAGASSTGYAAAPNNMVVGSSSPATASAVLDIQSTTKGVVMPRLTTAQMNAILTPADGLELYNTDEGIKFIYNTEWGWESNSKSYQRRNGFEYFNEMLAPMGNGGSDGYLIASLSGGGVTADGVPAANRPGIMKLSTLGAVAGRASITTDISAAQTVILGGGKILMETSVRVPVLSTSTERFVYWQGVGTFTTPIQNRAVMFLYDEGGTTTDSAATGNWQVMTSTSNIRTYTSTAVTVVAGQWYKLKMVINAAGTSVDFYIDNVLVKTETATMPTLAGYMAFNCNILKIVGTTPRTAEIDYLYLKQKFTTLR